VVLLAAVRSVFSDGQPRDDETALRDLAAHLGYGRTGPRIRERLTKILKTAQTRRLIEREAGNLHHATGCLVAATRDIGDYSQNERVHALVSGLNRSWIEREDAIRAGAAYLGFRRVGNNLRDAFKSAINGAIRRGLIEYDGTQIRKAKK